METTKIDPGIEELMERIRQHARESRLDRSRDTTDPSASSSPPVALPPVPSTKQLTMKAPKSEKLLTLLEHARGKTDVSRNIPKFLHRLFRKQGGFNRLLLESLTLLLRTSLDLHKQTSGVVAHIQAQTRWFESLVNAREEDLGRVADIEHRVESAEVSHADSTAHLEQRDDALEKRLDNFSRDLAQRDDAVGKRLDSFSRDLAQGDDALEKRLDNFSRDLAQSDDALEKRLDSFSRDLAQRDDAVGKRIDSLSRDLAAIGRELSAAAAHLGRLQAHTELTEVSSKAVLTQLERDVSQLRRDAGMALVSANRVDERQFADSSHFRAQLSVFTKLLRAEAERQSDGLSVAADTRPTLTPANIDNGLADAFYLAFEDAFRGPRANIKSRQAIYIPYIAKVNEGEERKPVLDLGCGRGEWLELLGENNLAANGVDLNDTMVDSCRERGIDVVKADALEYLKGTAAESFSAVTAFHLIEHLPFANLIELLREALRVLQPGGLLICETPNPANLQVGAHFFYRDPTHQRPLPPDSTRFLALHVGFHDAQIVPVNPCAPGDKVADDGLQVTERVNKLLYGPQDYAIIATK